MEGSDHLQSKSNNNGQESMTEGSNDNSTSESYYSIESATPGGNSNWIPVVPQNEKPKEGQKFKSLEDAIEMYSNYAEKSGFDIRLSTQNKNKSGIVNLKYILCSKAYLPNTADFDSLVDGKSGKKNRTVNIKKTDCKARIKIRLVKGTTKYEVYEFEERHNHEMVAIQYRHLLRKRRKLDPIEEAFVHRSSATNIGATRAHSLLSNLKGSRDLVHGTVVDFKNYRRDLNMYAGDNDAQMLVTKMEARTKHLHNFSFEYQKKDSELSAFFWADEMAKINYAEFGDIVSFDATYDTNRYKMVFVPFTGVDNHGKCVTFGAGMLTKEDTASYKWLLQCFLRAFKKEPNIVVSDQDPAMRKAIDEEFKVAKHRLCMWHITDKLPAKFSSSILENSNFKQRFHKLIWNLYMGPLYFEDEWKKLLKDFKLVDHKWLKDMYNIKELWIPAYFKNVEMCGLMRTSSRSESENAFFAAFTKHSDTLLQFMFSFDAAMEKQRYIQETLDHQTLNTVPKFKTLQNIERDASKKFTRVVFKVVQKEIVDSMYKCTHDTINTEEGNDCYMVREKRMIENEKEKEEGDPELKEIELYSSEKLNEYKVIHDRKDSSLVCTCQMFSRLGIPCRHMFYVLKNCYVEEIPKEYVKKRWTKNLIAHDIRKNRNLYSDIDLEAEKLASEAVSAVDSCLRSLINNKEELKDYVEKIKKLKKEIEDKGLKEKQNSKKKRIQSIMGVAVPENREIENPTVARNKGWASGKRIVGDAEKSKVASKKQQRKCGRCGEYGTKHNKRTCKVILDATGKTKGTEESEGSKSTEEDEDNIDFDEESSD